MDAPLHVCTKEEQRAVIRFLWAEGVSDADIHRRLLMQYGDSVIPRCSVYKWINKFKTGQTSIRHEGRLARPL